jgi:hypothetical protein
LGWGWRRQANSLPPLKKGDRGGLFKKSPLTPRQLLLHCPTSCIHAIVFFKEGDCRLKPGSYFHPNPYSLTFPKRNAASPVFERGRWPLAKAPSPLGVLTHRLGKVLRSEYFKISARPEPYFLPGRPINIGLGSRSGFRIAY